MEKFEARLIARRELLSSLLNLFTIELKALLTYDLDYREVMDGVLKKALIQERRNLRVMLRGLTALLVEVDETIRLTQAGKPVKKQRRGGK